MRWLVSLLAACAGATGVAAENFLASPAYRLRVEQPEAYRLIAAEGQAPAPVSRGESAPAQQLANKPFAALIDNAAREAALDPALVHAVIHVESRYDPVARSPKGAVGLMQVLPETAARYGVADPAHTPAANLRAGTRYLSALMEMFGGRLDLVLAAYNAGENAVLRHGERIPPYRETQHYVPAVLEKYHEWRGSAGLDVPATPSKNAALPPFIEYLPGTRLESRFELLPQ